MGHLPYNEATNEGTAQIFESMLQKQFGLKEDDPRFTDHLRIVYGDQLTASRMHTYKTERLPQYGDPYGRAAWLLPVFGLWHLKFNYLKLIWEKHWGGPQNNDDKSSLWWAHHHWHGKASINHTKFHQLESLVIHTWQAKIVAIFIHIWGEGEKGWTEETQAGQKIYDRDDIENYIESKTPKEMDRIVRLVMERLSGISLKKSGERPIEERDEIWLNNVKFIRNVTPYLVLKAAIKHADIDMLRHAIDECCILFAGATNKTNYQRELLYYKWITDSKAANARLQEVVLYNSLINRRGQADSYFEADLSVELLNRDIKGMRDAKPTSTKSDDLLLGRYTLVFRFYEKQREIFRKVLTTKRNAYQKHKSVKDQLYTLAHWMIHSDLAKELPKGRISIFEPPDLMTDGITQLPLKIQAFARFCDDSGIREKENAPAIDEALNQLLFVEFDDLETSEGVQIPPEPGPEWDDDSEVCASESGDALLDNESHTIVSGVRAEDYNS